MLKYKDLENENNILKEENKHLHEINSKDSEIHKFKLMIANMRLTSLNGETV